MIRVCSRHFLSFSALVYQLTATDPSMYRREGSLVPFSSLVCGIPGYCACVLWPFPSPHDQALPFLTGFPVLTNFQSPPTPQRSVFAAGDPDRQDFRRGVSGGNGLCRLLPARFERALQQVVPQEHRARLAIVPRWFGHLEEAAGFQWLSGPPYPAFHQD